MGKATNRPSVQAIVGILSQKGPMTAGQVGLELWWRDGLVTKPENQTATMFCRPAGRLLHRARREGLVKYRDHGRVRLWSLNASAVLSGNGKLTR